MTSVLVIGSGGREHALAWKLRQSPDVDRLYIAPGNAGTGLEGENVLVAATDIPAIVRLVRERDIDLTVVGPEAPLALGLADALSAEGRRVLGPSAAAMRLEASKSFAKDVMRQAGVPTASYRVFDDAQDAHLYLVHCAYPVVIKADGLAAGKGVVICSTWSEARNAVTEFMLAGLHGQAGCRIVIEEAISGPEVSLLALVDGARVVPWPITQDHKRLGDADTGPNTGGMGAYAPVPFLGDEERDHLCETLLQPVVDSLAAMGTPYRGILFAGLMLTTDGPRVLEFNCRGGDPETQVILPLLADDLLPWLEMTARGCLEGKPQVLRGSAIGVVLAAPGYPENPATGVPIEGLDQIPSGVHVFHAGTAADHNSRTVTAGGRVLTIVGTGRTLDEAAERAYASPVRFEGMQRRSDIGWQARTRSDFAQVCRLFHPSVGGSFPSNHDQSERTVCRPTPSVGGWTPAQQADWTANSRPRRASAYTGGSSAQQADWTASKPPTEGVGLHGSPRRLARIAVLASGGGSNLQAIIEAIDIGSLDAEIALVVSHNPEAGALQRARYAGIQTASLTLANRKDATQRSELEKDLLELLAPLQIDLIVLAGWMLILSEEFLTRCGCRVINVHPALLTEVPTLRGAHAVRDALALGLPFTGVSIHDVTPEVDSGPVILAERVEIFGSDTEVSLYARIRRVEHRLLPEAIQSILYSVPIGEVYA